MSTPEFVKKHMKHAEKKQDVEKTTSPPAPEETEEIVDEHAAQLMRLQAEMENLRKRLHKDIEKAHKYALEPFASELLPVVDSLEHGVNIEIGDNEFAKNVHDGLKGTLDLLLSKLAKFGIHPVDPLNQPFNPEFHQAISTETNQAVAANTVLKVLQKGYTLNSRLMRPALVIVAKQ